MRPGQAAKRRSGGRNRLRRLPAMPRRSGSPRARRGRSRLSLNPREDRVEVWAREPVPPGGAKTPPGNQWSGGRVSRAGGLDAGRRRERPGECRPGAYRFDVPKGVDVTAGVAVTRRALLAPRR